MRVSVIIPTYNSCGILRKCVESILSQTIKLSEVIVVDNGSTNVALVYLKKIFPRIKLLKLENNTGVTGGRNAGIKIADKRADYLLFFDHDMVADKNMVKELIEVVETDDAIGIATPKIYYWEDKKRIWSAGTGINLWTGQVLFRGGMDVGQYNEVEEVQVAPAAILVKKKVLDEIGGFDEKYFAVYEDTDYCFRAGKMGFKVIYAPKAVSYHNLSTDPKNEAQRLLERSYWIGRNRILFMKDFGKNFYVFALFMPLSCIYYLKLAIENKSPRSFILYMRGLISGLVLNR